MDLPKQAQVYKDEGQTQPTYPVVFLQPDGKALAEHQDCGSHGGSF